MTRRDAVWILSFLISGALGLAFYVQFFDRAFPVASLNFRVDRQQAYRAAEAYLHRLGYDLTEYESAQGDHTFTYRKRNFVVGDDGHYRLHVTVQGDRVGSFAEYLKIPETFSRDYREIRARAGLLTKVAGGFAFAPSRRT